MHRFWLLLGTALALTLLAACGGKAAPTPTPTLSPEEAIARAIVATSEEVRSYRFTMDMEMKMAREQLAMDFEGEAQLPDRLRMNATVEGCRIDMVMIGPTIYAKDCQSTRWQVEELSALEGGLVAAQGGLTSPAQAIESLKAMLDIQELKGEKIRGVETRHFGGAIDMKKAMEQALAEADIRVEDLTSAEQQALEVAGLFSVDMELWVGRKDHLIRRIKLVMELPEEGLPPEMAAAAGANFVFDMELFDFNVSVDIKAPVE